jgi:hypothetical protein
MAVPEAQDEGVASCLRQLQELVSAETDGIAGPALRGAMSILVKAFLVRGLDGGRATELVDTGTVTPTEAATAACALIAAFDLSPFDLAMWQTRLAYLSVGEKK